MECLCGARGDDVELVLGGNCRESRVRRCRVKAETLFYA